MASSQSFIIKITFYSEGNLTELASKCQKKYEKLEDDSLHAKYFKISTALIMIEAAATFAKEVNLESKKEAIRVIDRMGAKTENRKS